MSGINILHFILFFFNYFLFYFSLKVFNLLDFIRDADGDSGGDAAKALYNFFRNVMDDENYGRFMGVLNDKNTIIDLEFIGEIASWLETAQKAALAGIDAQHLQLVRLRVAFRGQHAGDGEGLQFFRRIFDAFDLKPDGVERVADLRHRRGRIKVILEPGQRELHARAPTPADRVGWSNGEKP